MLTSIILFLAITHLVTEPWGMTSTLLVEKILMPDSREIELSGDVAVIFEVGKTCMSKHL